MTCRGDVYFVPVLYPFFMIALVVRPDAWGARGSD
ncbi:hypothetical protein SLEP1_g20577 [Rubroshorea leprosula]|uniref:Uncharacterized protein n=1 Tax=Rubroshorea leprosula TaxID=152421 RepID=A0AAV5J6E1_9ROSI|nr:hypothetical protein SLEP1_g20577 [Rubroshorea leprosula]